MPAAKLKLIIEKGATFRPHFTYNDANGVLIDLTGYSGRMEIRPNIESDTIIISLTTDNGGITLGNGTVDLFISAAATAAITDEDGQYDLEIQSPGTPPSGGIVTRLLEGRVVFHDEVTR